MRYLSYASVREGIFGNMATVFHRTSVSNLINQVYTDGFKPGSGSLYGRGFYSTYDLDSQLRLEMRKYGDIIVKFAVPIDEFFIYDYAEFKKSPNFRKLNQPSYETFIAKQAEYYRIFDKDTIDSLNSKLAEFYKRYPFPKETALTSDLAYEFFSVFPKIKTNCNGIIFTGRQDGKVLVAYDTSIIMPISFKQGSNDFKSVELNKEYLRQWSKNKTAPHGVEAPKDIWDGGKWTGDWKKGIWYRGTFVKGVWRSGTWEDGDWLSGIWLDGTWNNGVWNDGTWKNGVRKDGDWVDGIWKNGVWEDGTWYGGTWEHGKWKTGSWYSTKFKHFILNTPLDPNTMKTAEAESETLEALERMIKNLPR